ncbi:caspase family protein [Tropicimonas sp. TH_r6]|uniref:caspase family protein n=1 Tax=Tropicimonas sp. TH_r6 TaxID=3082085 RepID=UPI002954592C|nr:caspase family protein [Tropicimonas sp. TH_r6]MDV7143982.1 caspase family protein [Tropicimonas sp. TH_r6]
MPRISLDELEALVADPARPDTDIAQYFVLDETASRPFAPVYKLDPELVEIPVGPEGLERSAAALNLANWYAHTRRIGRYYAKVNGGYAGPVIVSEGDSWFQYPVRLHDTIDKLMERYAVYSLGAAGDLLKQIARKQQYLKALQETGGSILLLSGGGNDLVAGGALADYLEEFDVDLRPGDYLKSSFQSLLDSAFGHYETICRQVLGAFPHVEILCHGYDYPVPASGRWLGKPMETRGIRDSGLQKAIAAEMMDRFNRGLWRMARRFRQVTYIDCRGVVGDNRWFDELHPTNAGYADVAARFDREIRRIANATPTRRARSGGPFASGLPATKSTPRAGRAISLHCGLNEVDPQHYAGWDGALVACENDARAMAKLAAAQGFEAEILLTRDATREAVVASIRSAAETLKDGDMFLWTISCHGGQMPDLNRDEAPDRDGYLKDETLLLYDFQIVDDELFTLWSEFAPGVRILFVPDCCHSGTNIRAAMPGSQAPRIRQIPAAYAARTFVQNERAYRDYASHYDAIREEVIHNPLTTPVKASVMSLTACQDHQVAMDGARHGAFTGAVLKVWADGKFNGNYKSFRDEVDRTIDSPDQTPNFHSTGAEDPAFAAQVPFTVWTNPGGTVLGAGAQLALAAPLSGSTAPMASGSPLDWLTGTEGIETDDLSEAVVAAIAAGTWRSPVDPSVRSGETWGDAQAFFDFIGALGLRHFSPGEFVILGDAHHGAGPCAGRNLYPPRHLWGNVVNTARVVDELRERIGKPVVIVSAYRAPGYNACIGGDGASVHMRYNALDFKVPGMSSEDVAWALRQMRDVENRFSGGIGLYDSFVHVDTRGFDATWPAAFREAGAPSGTDLRPSVANLSSQERRAQIEGIELAAPARPLPRVRSAFRAPSNTDEAATLTMKKQKLNAAIDASGVISFVDNLTPQQKDDVLLSTLFAQRAATARKNPVTEVQAWFTIYLDTLSLLGWSVESAPELRQSTLTQNASFHDAILKILASVATQSQFAILEQALSSLASLSESSSQIRLFDRATSVTEGGHFQIGAAEASGDVVAMALGAFHYRNEDERKNVLFVSWGDNEVTYWMGAQKVNLSTRLYGEVRDLVSERLGENRRKLIADIDLG